jgi:3-phenylpropionate/cinnamic acid dioxygenase small subunit
LSSHLTAIHQPICWAEKEEIEMDKMEYLIERQAISDLLLRYGRALDDRDWEKLRTCFTPDAKAIYGEDPGLRDGYEAIEQTCRSALEPLDSSQHIITNHEIEINGNVAHSRSCMHAQHTKNGISGGDNFTLGGTYIDDLVKTPDGWKIRQKHLVLIWQEGNMAVLGQ